MQHPSRASRKHVSNVSNVSAALLVAVIAAASAAAGCTKGADAARRQSEEATAEAEERAQEATLTSATFEAKEEAKKANDDALRAKGEMIAAFRLEQSDYRGRIARALDALDKEIAHPRASQAGRPGAKHGSPEAYRARRDLLKTDLDLLERSTEPDWATTRSKLDRDLAGSK